MRSWVAPVQVKVIPVSNAVHEQYANEIALKLAQAGVRVEQDARDEKLGYKIREAQKKCRMFLLLEIRKWKTEL